MQTVGPAFWRAHNSPVVLLAVGCKLAQEKGPALWFARPFGGRVCGSNTTKSSTTRFAHVNPLVRSLRLADYTRVFLGEKSESDSDFLLIFPNDRLQEGKKFFLLLGIVLRVVYVSTDLSNEFYVVHKCPLPRQNIFL